MRALLAYAGMMLRLQFRNRLAVFYSFLFPLIFLVAFRILYRFSLGHGADHLGELLTVAILGGTCFGLPVTMVAERERGVWRRYRLLPAPVWTLVGGTLGVRFVLLIGAGLLQLLGAVAVRMQPPTHPLDLALGFAVVSFTFCGFGLIVAMLTSSVQAAQALGQCIFLPMLALGGIAYPLTQLPHWTQVLAAFTPGRYAVEVLYACSGLEGQGFLSVRYELTALLLMGAAACVTAAGMFRWDVNTGHERRSRLGWLAVTLAACLAVGFSTLRRDAAAAAQLQEERAIHEKAALEAETTSRQPAVPVPPPEEKIYAVEKAASWDVLTPANLLELPRGLPPDTGIVTPIAANLDEIDEETQARGKAIYDKLAAWAPGKAKDPLQRVSNLLYVASVVDVMQIAPLESYLPVLVEQYLWESSKPSDLVRQLAWIATHPLPDDLATVEDMAAIGIEVTTNRTNEIESRMHIYAAKFMFRLLDDPDSGAIPKDSAAK